MHRSLLTASVAISVLAIPANREVWAAITGPSSVKPGALVTLQAEHSGADAFAWVFLDPPGVDHRQLNENRELVFASGCQPGTSYTVVLIAISFKDGKPRVATETFSLTVEGSAPDPDPDPPPGPDPPPLPGGRFGLASLAHQWALEVSPQSRRKSALLAANFEAVASAMVAGAFSTVEAALIDLRTRNQQALGTDVESWRSWFEKLADKQDQLYEANELRTLSDYSQAYREVSWGLRAVGGDQL